ncbi:O-antigen ligase domain-containing protein [Acidipropionibacterium acidipropionici]|uniref:Polymerase n=1 Tax=Acidipropionibacterium acidipropionici TaxID=1748 RepID=A0AAC8YGH5_9ACTN|nr:O-antigen ligase family protein [Acidipropionibacterium acidipropionici]AMS06049.1 polymerase [Acidipropionibacterium acidipropionici]AOZ47512.1 polymerase [Acidipropionibacterium acidipropionici]AZP39169.1 O-antigen ligase domain-containing protein [Acidipropionibacterium acidipropionici]
MTAIREAWKPGAALGLVAALLVMRLPLSFVLFLALPWVMVLGGCLRRTGLRSRPLEVLLAWCFVASFASVVLLHPSSVLSTGNNAAIMTAVIGYTLVIFRSEHPGLAARNALQGLYIGAVCVWLMGIGEMVTGIKLLPILYPGANTIGYVDSSRFMVSATYPNINDFCVVMTMLFIAVLARMWFNPARGARRWRRWILLLTSTAMVIIMGSRGALMGCIAGLGLLAILNIRRQYPAALGWRAVIYGGGAAVVGLFALSQTHYIQDNSTLIRGRILRGAMAMLADSPSNSLLGYGSLADYQSYAKAAFGPVLMDPHNLLLEMWLRYGVVALLLFVVVWLWVLVRGFLPRRPMIDWQTAFGLTIVVLLPVIGIVPSSMLRYHVTWVYLAAACLLTAEGIRRRSAGEPGVASVATPAVIADDLGDRHDDQTDHDTAEDGDQRRADHAAEPAGARSGRAGARD